MRNNKNKRREREVWCSKLKSRKREEERIEIFGEVRSEGDFMVDGICRHVEKEIRPRGEGGMNE